MSQRSRVVIEEVEWLKGWDHKEGIARRLGYSRPKHLAKMLRTWGRPDLAAGFDEEGNS